MRRVRVLASVLPSVAVLAALGEGLDTLGAAFVLFFRRVAFAGLLDELPAG